jgi:formate hydrogenlyase subunit 3/multisubunit Na+/H+ antiporter MnhD subunit
MNIFNLYSALIFGLAGLILVGLLLFRRRMSLGRVIALIVLGLALLVAWWLVRPVQTAHDDLSNLMAPIGAGKPVLLEFQSPY